MKWIGIQVAVFSSITFAASSFAQDGVRVATVDQVTNCVKVDSRTCKSAKGADKCMEWHKRYAPGAGGDTIVVRSSADRKPVFGFIGRRGEVYADYYDCKITTDMASNPWDDFAVRYASYVPKGDTSIRGQAFLRQRGGDVVTCAGSEVIAFPAGLLAEVSTLPDRVWRVLQSDGTGIPANVRATVRSTRCDAQGNFEFRNLPSGTWQIMTHVTWQAPVSGHLETQGGVLTETVESAKDGDPIYLTEKAM